MDAGDRFELPMLQAYETEVVASLPAIIVRNRENHPTHSESALQYVH